LRKRQDIQLFSTSAIDILSCVLAAAAVIWVLLLRNNGLIDADASEKAEAIIRVSQYGIKHIMPSVDSELIGKTENGRIGFKFRELANPDGEKCISDSKNCLAAQYKKSEGFGNQVVIRATGVTERLTVTIPLEICYSPSEIHYSEISVISANGIDSYNLLWQGRNELEDAVSKFRSVSAAMFDRKEWLRSIVTQPRKNWCLGGSMNCEVWESGFHGTERIKNLVFNVEVDGRVTSDHDKAAPNLDPIVLDTSATGSGGSSRNSGDRMYFKNLSAELDLMNSE
jgi:hypothetical protein